MRQAWVCVVCGLSGAVDYRAEDGVFTVVYAIEDQHDRVARKHAPHCRFDVHNVRVWNRALMDEYAWNKFVASFERWPDKLPGPTAGEI